MFIAFNTRRTNNIANTYVFGARDAKKLVVPETTVFATFLDVLSKTTVFTAFSALPLKNTHTLAQTCLIEL
jgi:hypothetical protein